MTVVGNGPDEADLHTLCAELGLSDVVSFPGYTSDPARYLRESDCYVLSSRWEGFPLVLLEALRFGLPLLAVDCEFGPADLITDASIGELVAVGDPDALADGLVAAAHRAADPAAEQHRREVALGYSREAAAAQHLDVIEQIAAGVGR